MLYAAILMKFIYEHSPCHDNLPSDCTDEDGNPNPAPLNVWIVSGPYILVGISEYVPSSFAILSFPDLFLRLFATLVSNEYAYTKSPKRMKSTVMAFSLFMSAVSALLNLALTAVNVENKFTWLFGSFSVIAFIVGILFFIGFRKLDQEEQHLNVVGLGERQGFAGESADVTTATHHHGEEKLGAGAVKLAVL